jgi:hypothetical protein
VQAAFKERMVRRQLRHVAAGGRRRHAVRLVWWTLAMVPQLPLMLTPLPNLTVYYTGYRIYSHFRALQVASQRWVAGAACWPHGRNRHQAPRVPGPLR